MIAKEGFFNSLTLLSILTFFVFIDIMKVNPFLIITVFILAVIFNPAIWAFLWFLFETLGSLLGIAVGSIAGPEGSVLGLIIGAIGAFVGFLIMVFTRVLPFALGLIYAFVIVPQGLLLASWGIGLYFVSILMAYFLIYYLLFGNEYVIYGMVATLIIAGLHTQSMSFIIGLAIACLAGALLGVKASMDLRTLLNYGGLIYYMSLCGIYMVLPGAEILQTIAGVLQYVPLFAPANLIILLFIMNIFANKMEWNSTLFKLMAMAYILYSLGSAILPAWHVPFTFFMFGNNNVIVHPENYDAAIIGYLNLISPAVAALYKSYARYLGWAVAFLVYSIFHPSLVTPEKVPMWGPNLMDLYFLLCAFIIIVLAFIFDLVTGLVGYSVFPMIKQVTRLPKKLAKVSKEKEREEKKKAELALEAGAWRAVMGEKAKEYRAKGFKGVYESAKESVKKLFRRGK